MTSPCGPVVLGVETSCDETGIGIVIGDQLCANVIASSIDEQARFGTNISSLLPPLVI